jgi:hypothetical protein
MAKDILVDKSNKLQEPANLLALKASNKSS